MGPGGLLTSYILFWPREVQQEPGWHIGSCSLRGGAAASDIMRPEHAGPAEKKTKGEVAHHHRRPRPPGATRYRGGQVPRKRAVF